jgi:general stress protein YciG
LRLEPTEDVQMANSKSGSSKRGFAAMSPEKQREIAAKGGRASHGGGGRAYSPPTGQRSGG